MKLSELRKTIGGLWSQYDVARASGVTWGQWTWLIRGKFVKRPTNKHGRRYYYTVAEANEIIESLTVKM